MALIDRFTTGEILKVAGVSSSMADFMRRLGYARDSTLTRKSVLRVLDERGISLYFAVPPKKVRRIIDSELFVYDINKCPSQSVIRTHYKAGNYSEYKCAICGLGPLWKEKPLTMILDHIDGDHHNNTLDNLRWVCPNCNQQLPTTNRRKPVEKKKKVIHRCIDCGVPIYYKSLRCTDCYIKYRKENTDIPSKEIIYNLLLSKSFEEIGRIYGVTGNAVKKWCRKYDLPFMYNDVKAFRKLNDS